MDEKTIIENIDSKSSDESTEATTADNGEEAEIGFSEDRDEYGREVLPNTFFNVLTMSKNIVKLNYSELKNAILSFTNVRTRITDNREVFLRGRNKMFMIELKGDQTLLYVAIPSDALDKKVYPHRTLKSSDYRETPTLLTVKTPISLSKAKELIDLAMRRVDADKLEHYTRIAFAEKYPVNPNAVLKGKENVPPKEDEYLGKDYEDIYGELTGHILSEYNGDKKKSRKKQSGAEKLQEQRQTAKTIKGAVSIAEPIVYFYNLALDYENNPSYLTIQQVLNDRYLGKLLPSMYFAIAEGSARIEELNFLSLRHATETANSNKKFPFVLAVSPRLLMKAGTLQKLITESQTEDGNLILSFDSALLEAMGEQGLQALRKIKDNHIKIMLDNTENAGMRILTEADYDFLRFDGRYYDKDTPAAIAHLKVLTGFAKTLGISVSAYNVANQKDAERLVQNGVDVIEGDAIGTPKRLVSLALREFKKIPPVERK